MKKFSYGFIFGAVVATVGLSNIALVFDHFLNIAKVEMHKTVNEVKEKQ